MSKTKKIIHYILLILVSAAFLMAGISKLMGNDQAIQGFAVAGLPIWLMYVVGVAEVLGVIGIWIRNTRAVAAVGLYIILLGAIVVSAVYVNVPTALFPIVTAIALYFAVRLGRSSGTPAPTAPASTPSNPAPTV